MVMPLDESKAADRAGLTAHRPYDGYPLDDDTKECERRLWTTGIKNIIKGRVEVVGAERVVRQLLTDCTMCL